MRHWGDNVLWHIPAHKVRAVDTTGAGERFHGACACALTKGKSPVECALTATAAAAISVTGPRGRMALPGHGACLAKMAEDDAPTPIPMG